MNVDGEFITGKLFIDTGKNDDGIPFDVYLGEHMTIFHKAGYVRIGLPYNKRSNYNDNFTVSTSIDTQQKSELRDFFWDKNNKLLCVDEAEFNKQGNNLSIALKSQCSNLGLYNKTNSTLKSAYHTMNTINKDAYFLISPSTKPSEIAKQFQAQLGTNFVKTDHITSIEQKELGNPNEQTKLENQQKEIFCSPTIWCGFNLCNLCNTETHKQIS